MSLWLKWNIHYSILIYTTPYSVILFYSIVYYNILYHGRGVYDDIRDCVFTDAQVVYQLAAG